MLAQFSLGLGSLMKHRPRGLFQTEKTGMVIRLRVGVGM